MTNTMDVPLYILGLLRRYGPQHGYQINKSFTENIADFARIKLPTIYYHLERLAAAGFLDATAAKESTRPERTVYAINARGEERFIHDLNGLLEIRYEPTFGCDALLYFSDSLDPSTLADSLDQYITKMQQAVEFINRHEAESFAVVPEESRPWAAALFDHHRSHYQAEADWARRTLENLKPQLNKKESRK